MSQQKQGSLVVVGSGISVGGQTTISARSHIQSADIVMAAVASGISMHWIKSHNDNVVSLGSFYQEGKSRAITYLEMIDAIAEQVYLGLRVCAVFYGHPGVFAYPGHKVVEKLSQQGYNAHMEPGISAEDCVIADLGLDPATHGCIAMEASQFLFYQHPLNPHCLLILWQFGMAGDHQFLSQIVDDNRKGLQILFEELLSYYPPNHEIILYEASQLAIQPARIERMALSDLPQSKPTMISTLVIPALGMPPFDHRVLAKFGINAQTLVDNLQGLFEQPDLK